MDKSLLNFNETKKYLKISRATLYRLLECGKIPASKVGGQWRFRGDRLEKWLEAQELNYKSR